MWNDGATSRCLEESCGGTVVREQWVGMSRNGGMMHHMHACVKQLHPQGLPHVSGDRRLCVMTDLRGMHATAVAAVCCGPFS